MTCGGYLSVVHFLPPPLLFTTCSPFRRFSLDSTGYPRSGPTRLVGAVAQRGGHTASSRDGAARADGLRGGAARGGRRRPCTEVQRGAELGADDRRSSGRRWRSSGRRWRGSRPGGARRLPTHTTHGADSVRHAMRDQVGPSHLGASGHGCST
jgi:hypothetical protein